jgi:hypothetical protein
MVTDGAMQEVADGATAVAHARIAARMDRMRTAVEALLDPNQVLLPTPAKLLVYEPRVSRMGRTD